MRVAALVAFVAGVCLLQVQPELPGIGVLGALAAVSAAALVLAAIGAGAAANSAALGVAAWRRSLPEGDAEESKFVDVRAAGEGRPSARLRAGLVVAAAGVLGFAYAAGLATLRMADQLSFADEGRDVLVEGVVSSLPARLERGVRFEFDVERVATPDATVPSRLLLGWYSEGMALQPAQRWRFAVRLKRPHGVQNPGGFDFEAWLLERNLRATGVVRTGRHDPVPQRLDDRVDRPGLLVERARAALRDRLAPLLEGRRYGGVLLALIVGDQRAISAQDWTLFNRTGIAHLVSISGLHITMIASLVGALVGAAWRRTPALVGRVPVQIAAVTAGLAAAFGYALLAGWGIPAQRTVLMLAVVALAWLVRARVGLGAALMLAAAVVCLVDPWSVLAVGFWLSFGAVAAIAWVAHGRVEDGAQPGWRRALAVAVRVQLAVTLALMPATVVVFHQLSLVSPVANAVAIPVVSWIVTPLALVAAVLALLPDAFVGLAHVVMGLSHAVFEPLAAWLAWLAASPAASGAVATPPWFALALAGVGIAWLLAPPGWPVRWLGAAIALPLFVWPAERPAPGEAWVTALDIGQGSAILLETRDRAWLYDTGPRYASDSDAGERIVLPYLRHRGIGRLDGLIVSHLDADHSGGTAAILRGLPVARVISSIASGHPMFGGRPVERCEAGTRWSDGALQFTLLHPPASDYERRRTTNAMSCAALVTVGARRLLLTGDIGVVEEAAILARWPDLAADWVAAPHHGSRSSSSARLLGALGAREAVAQAGYRNRYGQPDPGVAARYAGAGITLRRTDHGGALQWRILPGGEVRVSAWRTERVRYWHNRPAPAAPPPRPEENDSDEPSSPAPLETFFAASLE